ncbi:trem-like transcript 2 protein [Vombatus ursinus]|uniref:Trem-like transcript 2 protein n=1 Tax=Vombatus ursinus TaxID=29139 RepID=A0A4X2LQP7_VOMUR|nr:trem-like transcript 2 protein [Vombatus ursinus]XP_027732418.1 trem-like transcript 2 protein [Vombatus ursinus]XP_027732422.1 trem-like transcript 2 protein [Vombatus ursinus]XP_027732423.1 trem-like transcript 2 protein [Vombatus ursinus]
MEPGTCLWLLLLLLLLFYFSASQAEDVYTTVRHREGETLSVQCSYTVRSDRWEGKVWCKVRRKKCDSRFSRGAGFSPPYKLHDDSQAGLLIVTMERLRHQDSGKYWCMRNSSRSLYPVKGIQLVVSRAPSTERNSPLITKEASIQELDHTFRTAVTTGPFLTKSKDLPMVVPITTSIPAFMGTMPADTATLPTMARSMTTISRVKMRFTPVTRPITTATLRMTTRSSATSGSPCKSRSTRVAPVMLVTVKARSSGTVSTTIRSYPKELTPNSFHNSSLTGSMLLGGSFTILMFSVVFYVLWRKKRMGIYYV